MTTPEADPADLAEQQVSAARDEPGSEDVEVPLEASAADAAEQAAAVEEDDEYR